MRHHQRRQRGRRNRRRGSVALLRHVHLAVPPAPGLRRREHTATAAHVAERTCRTDVRTGPADTRNTGHRTTRAPGRSSVPVTGLVLVGVSLALVLPHVRVDVANEVRTKRRREDRREDDGLLARRLWAVVLVDRDGRAGSCHSALEKERKTVA